MITLTSNIDRVIQQLHSLRDEVPRAIQRALAWEKWIERAGEVAESTLNALAGPDDQAQVRPFVEAIKGVALTGKAGFALTLSSPLPRVRALLADAIAARGSAANSADAMLGLFRGSITSLEEALLEWVQTEKHKDQRDFGKTDEDVARLISYILISPRLGAAGESAREGLMRHIVPWLQRREEEASGLPPETVDRWLRAVLAAWRVMVETEVAARIRAELKSKKFP